ncbi:MAG: chemotaxis protein CheW [Planctomycetaceae bacterium]|nr:chemotaxis protein CheW [Planctomycetaceae bacterium]
MSETVDKVQQSLSAAQNSGTGDVEDTLKDMYLSFRLGDEDYCIEIRHVTEIVGMQKITEVPDMPHYVKGVVNLRGQVIPVIDMRLRFNMEGRSYDERTCIVVITLREGQVQVGLVVDTVNEVRSIDAGNVSPPPKSGTGQCAQYIRGLGKVGVEVKIILDVNKLLFENELDSFGV